MTQVNRLCKKLSTLYTLSILQISMTYRSKKPQILSDITITKLGHG